MAQKHDSGKDGAELTVLITGANRGLGLALAWRFMAGGARVIAACRNPREAARQLPAGAEIVSLDVADPAAIAILAAQLSGRAIDVLVNNAAIRGDTGGLATLAAEDFMQVMRVNALAPLLLAQALIANLRRGRRKVIANISSRAGSMAEGLDADGDYAYRCSKAALNMATAKLAHDFGGDGLIALALHPGWVMTDMGGPEAEVSAAAAAAGLFTLICNAAAADNGTFRCHDGTPVRW